MAYHIAVDSCTDLTAEMKKDEHITLVPLTLNVGDEKFIDDETFNQAEFLKKVAECPEAPSSACPSPDAYMQAYGYNNDDAYAVTLSSELSGSYNSAKLGADLLKEEYPDKNIHVFNSRSASAGQTLITMNAWKPARSLRKSSVKWNSILRSRQRYSFWNHWRR